MFRRSTFLVVVLVAALALPGATAAGGDKPDEKYPWAGLWTSSFGAFGLRFESDKYGQTLLEKIGGKACSGNTQYYVGGYNNPDDVGKIRGCTKGSLGHLVGRFESNDTDEGGSFDINRQGAGWKGTWSLDGGDEGEWEGQFKEHFEGDRPPPSHCPKTYIIELSNEKIVANRKFTELSAEQKRDLRKKEAKKYEGFDYKPIGEVTRKQNCAGHVMRELYPKEMVLANVDPDRLYQKILVPYGKERLGRLTARPGDVVVYRAEDGVVKHVAIVESKRNGRLTILTKDGNERLYRAKFPRGPLSLTDDPLVTAHGTGGVEFWSLDTSKVSIREKAAGRCD